MIKEGDVEQRNIKLEKVTYIFMITVAVLMCLLLITILVFVIYTLTNLYKDKRLNLVYVSTSSMEPKVQHNSFVAYDEDYGTLDVGDIVIVAYEDGIYVQEITGQRVMAEKIFFSAKDSHSERLFLENNVYGVYEKTLTTLTNFTKFCRSFWGILVLIILPVACYISFEVYFLVKKLKLKYRRPTNLKESQENKTSQSAKKIVNHGDTEEPTKTKQNAKGTKDDSQEIK